MKLHILNLTLLSIEETMTMLKSYKNIKNHSSILDTSQELVNRLTLGTVKKRGTRKPRKN